jgi:Family of unknown function (DUF5670)
VLEVIAAVLIAAWFLALANPDTMGGYIHGPLVIALFVIVFRLLQLRRA